ncbi:uncharacterized protein LOC8077503 isoform X2 [Sorghum bicolor]|uniref:uncharacterized protein LOC8077503 isoform X2 n=1 Tax=Sorghum bicolor TaxID=4558 RepID=UPI000B423CB7|nr:uncharacterized protein LOC8077503 isoform X2 [Sorghum bicolor]|eukprot:XP_021308249.1 uncharacterized protein LOC8077503 isoform X2 [Sorghum bicolor]
MRKGSLSTTRERLILQSQKMTLTIHPLKLGRGCSRTGMMSLLIILTHLYNTLQKNIDSQSTNAFRDNSKNKRTVIGRSSPDVLPMGGRLKKPSIDHIDRSQQAFWQHCLLAAERMSLFLNASSAICRRYDARCKKLRYDIAFTRASVKDLHSRVLVAVHKIGFISKNIEDVRDKYLQTQLDELIGGFTRMWATMLE